MFHAFGAGSLWAVRSDVANSTPVQFGAVQEVGLEFSATTKQLFGSKQFPIAIARGTGKITGKAKIGSIQGLVFADLFFGLTRSTGHVLTEEDEAGSVPTTSPYTVTVDYASTFLADLGVRYASTGIPLTKVASSPAAGEYSVSAGVYTFNSAQDSAALLFSYTRTVSGSGQKLVITNQKLGIQPVFSMYLATNYTAPGGAQEGYLKLNACVSSKLSMPTKLEDFTIQEFDFEAFADSTGEIATWSMNAGD